MTKYGFYYAFPFSSTLFVTLNSFLRPKNKFIVNISRTIPFKLIAICSLNRKQKMSSISDPNLEFFKTSRH